VICAADVGVVDPGSTKPPVVHTWAYKLDKAA
jgi:hypothetical protein